MRIVVASLVLAGAVLCGLGRAADEAGDLARMAGEWSAESSIRTGQGPAPAQALAKLTVKVEKNQWVQAFGKDVAAYTMTLDPTRGTMMMRHNKTGVVLDMFYVLNGDKLMVTRVISRQPLDTEVKVWRRKVQRG